MNVCMQSTHATIEVKSRASHCTIDCGQLFELPVEALNITLLDDMMVQARTGVGHEDGNKIALNFTRHAVKAWIAIRGWATDLPRPVGVEELLSAIQVRSHYLPVLQTSVSRGVVTSPSQPLQGRSHGHLLIWRTSHSVATCLRSVTLSTHQKMFANANIASCVYTHTFSKLVSIPIYDGI